LINNFRIPSLNLEHPGIGRTTTECNSVNARFLWDMVVSVSGLPREVRVLQLDRVKVKYGVRTDTLLSRVDLFELSYLS